jgi:hypothetical protein
LKLFERSQRFCNDFLYQLDPVAPDLNRNVGTLIPIPRRSSQDSPSKDLNTGDQQRTVEHNPAHASEKEAISPLLGRKAPLLRLLELPQVSVDRTGNISVWTPSTGGELGVKRVWIPRSVWVKTLKSCILMAKVRACLILYEYI